jgi:Protein of unknown function (DUF433)
LVTPPPGKRTGFNAILTDVQQFSRIATNPEIMGGKPCIRGMRVTVGMIVEALAYAASLAHGREFPLAS